jgi:hypothetical protein
MSDQVGALWLMLRRYWIWIWQRRRRERERMYRETRNCCVKRGATCLAHSRYGGVGYTCGGGGEVGGSAVGRR